MPNDKAVSQRAYEIWESEGRPDGCDVRHWLQAAKELGATPSEQSGSAPQVGATPPSRLPEPTASESRPITPAADVRPPQVTRGPAPTREGKRGPGTPLGNERSRSGNGTSSGRRRS